jgi:uncharacterized alkaline shock family protein YloU
MSEHTRLGRIEVAPEAIATLASDAVLNSYGVVGMASITVGDGIAELLGREAANRGVRVKLTEDKIVIDLYVIIEYGTRVSTVAQNIMSAVQYSVERALGVDVALVNVHVQGLRVSSQ